MFCFMQHIFSVLCSIYFLFCAAYIFYFVQRIFSFCVAEIYENEILKAGSFSSDREKNILIYLMHIEQKILTLNEKSTRY